MGTRGNRHGMRLAGVLLAASALGACSTPLNFLAAIDGPYVSPERRAELAYRAAQEQQRLAAQAGPVAVASRAPAPTPTPPPVASATLVGPATAAPAELARPAPVAEQATLASPPVTAPAPAPSAAPSPAPPIVARAAMPAPAPTPAPAPLVSPSRTPAPTAAPATVTAPPPAAARVPAPAPSPTPAPTPAPSVATAFASPEPSPAPARAPVVAASLPAPVAAPAPAPVIAAPASPISPAAGLMGPVATREAAPAPLETRLPSAYDFVPQQPEVRRRPIAAPAPAPAPAPTPVPAASPREELPALATTPPPAAPSAAPAATARTPAPAPAPSPVPAPAAPRELQRAASAAGLAVVSAMPAPSAPTAAPGVDEGGRLREFYDFAVAKLDSNGSAAGRESVLLADPPSLDPALQRCGNLPPAVLVDLDPGNGLLPLVSRDATNPELARYLGLLRERGVTVFWISGHGPGAASQIRQRLIASGLDPSGNDPLIVTRFAGESKQARRYSLGESNCLLAILGDQRGDFDELYDYVLDPIMAAPLEEHVNHGWFIAPPPLD